MRLGNRANISLAVRVGPIHFALIPVLLALLPSLAHAGTWVVLAPKSYTRGNGPPATVTDTFSVLNPTAQYTLKAFNGGFQNDQTALISNTTVTVNGVLVMGPRDLKQDSSEVDVPITL